MGSSLCAPHAHSCCPAIIPMLTRAAHRAPKSLLASHHRTMQPVPCMSLIQEITKGSAFLPPKKEPR